MDAYPTSVADQSQRSAKSSRRRRRRGVEEIKSGRLPIYIQLAIILAAFGLGVLGLMVFLGVIGRPSQHVIFDQALYDADWKP